MNVNNVTRLIFMHVRNFILENSEIILYKYLNLHYI